MGRVISLATQKGGVGKTALSENIGIGLANNGYKVLLIDFDPQSSLTDCLCPEDEDVESTRMTIYDVMNGEIEDEPVDAVQVIIKDVEGVDLIPSDIGLSGTEAELFNTMCRERMLANFISRIRDDYDYILIDCGPSLGLLTINALAASDSVIIPMEPTFKSVKGVEQLMTTITRVQKKINPKLQVEGIVFNKVLPRSNSQRKIMDDIRERYGNVFSTVIPSSVREAESSAEGKSIYSYNGKGRVALAFEDLVDEFLDNVKEMNVMIGGI